MALTQTFHNLGLYRVDVGGAGSGYTTPPTLTCNTPSGGTAAKVRAIIGEVTGITVSVGTSSGFTHVPLVVFSGGGATVQAQGYATVSGGQVTAIAITSGGEGYTYAPTITLIAQGGDTISIGTATYVPAGWDTVCRVVVIDPGQGYGTCTITATSGGGSGVGTFTTYVGKLFTITDGVSQLTFLHDIFTGSSGSNGLHGWARDASGNLLWIWSSNSLPGNLAGYSVLSLAAGWTSSGTGTAFPTTFTNIGMLAVPQLLADSVTVRTLFAGVTVSSGVAACLQYQIDWKMTGQGNYVTATPTIINATGTVMGIHITNGGSGYTSAPTVTFTGGAGSGAAATAILTGSVVTGIAITNAGTGYTSAPTIGFTGGGGSSAAATAYATTATTFKPLVRVPLPGMCLPSGQMAAFQAVGGTRDWSTSTTVQQLSGVEDITLFDFSTNDVRYIVQGLVDPGPVVRSLSGNSTQALGYQLVYAFNAQFAPGNSMVLPRFVRAWGTTGNAAAQAFATAQNQAGGVTAISRPASANKIRFNPGVEQGQSPSLADIEAERALIAAAGIPLRWIEVGYLWREISGSGCIGDWYPKATFIPGSATVALRKAALKAQIASWHSMGYLVSLYFALGADATSDLTLGANGTDFINNAGTPIDPSPGTGTSNTLYSSGTVYQLDPTQALWQTYLANMAAMIAYYGVDDVKLDFTSSLGHALTSATYTAPAMEPGTLILRMITDFWNAIRNANPAITMQITTFSPLIPCTHWRSNDLYNSVRAVSLAQSTARLDLMNGLTLGNATRQVHGDFINGGGVWPSSSGPLQNDLVSYEAWLIGTARNNGQFEFGYNPWNIAKHTHPAEDLARIAKAFKGLAPT